MKDEYSRYIIEKFFVEDFFEENPDGEYNLEEKEEGGETSLHFKVSGSRSMAVKNLDKKNTYFLFFKEDKSLSLKKRVDHIVFEQKEDAGWIIHLIEMKSSIPSQEKWLDIKGKFRASYLLARAIGAILDMDIDEIRMYTSYEKISLDIMPENPVLRRARVGDIPRVPLKEWNGEEFGLRFGDKCRLSFLHTPIRVCRNKDENLEGQYQCIS